MSTSMASWMPTSGSSISGRPSATSRATASKGPWLWVTAIGVRRGVRHGDLTFGGNRLGGVRVDFAEPVRSFLKVPALYVTVEDLDGFAAALAARGIPGVDARKGNR